MLKPMAAPAATFFVVAFFMRI